MNALQASVYKSKGQQLEKPGGGIGEYLDSTLDQLKDETVVPLIDFAGKGGTLERWSEFNLLNKDQTGWFKEKLSEGIKGTADFFSGKFGDFEEVSKQMDRYNEPDQLLTADEANELYPMPHSKFTESVYKKAAEFKYDNYIKSALIKEAVTNAYNGDDKLWKSIGGFVMGMGVSSLNDAPNLIGNFIPITRLAGGSRLTNALWKIQDSKVKKFGYELGESTVDAFGTTLPVELSNLYLTQQAGGFLTLTDAAMNTAFGTAAGPVMKGLTSGFKVGFTPDPEIKIVQQQILTDLKANKDWINLSEEEIKLREQAQEIELNENKANKKRYDAEKSEEMTSDMEAYNKEKEEEWRGEDDSPEVQSDKAEGKIEESPEEKAKREEQEALLNEIEEKIKENFKAKVEIYKSKFLEYFPKAKEMDARNSFNIFRNIDSVPSDVKARLEASGYKVDDADSAYTGAFDKDSNSVYVFTDDIYGTGWSEDDINFLIQKTVFEESVIHYGFNNLLDAADIEKIKNDLLLYHKDIVDAQRKSNPDAAEDRIFEEAFVDVMFKDEWGSTAINSAFSWIKKLAGRMKDSGMNAMDLHQSMRHIFSEMRKQGKWGIPPKAKVEVIDTDDEADIKAKRESKGRKKRSLSARAQAKKINIENNKKIQQLKKDVAESKKRQDDQLTKAKEAELREANNVKLNKLLDKQVTYQGKTYTLTQERSGTITLVGKDRDVEIPIDAPIDEVTSKVLDIEPVSKRSVSIDGNKIDIDGKSGTIKGVKVNKETGNVERVTVQNKDGSISRITDDDDVLFEASQAGYKIDTGIRFSKVKKNPFNAQQQKDFFSFIVGHAHEHVDFASHGVRHLTDAQKTEAKKWMANKTIDAVNRTIMKAYNNFGSDIDSNIKYFDRLVNEVLDGNSSSQYYNYFTNFKFSVKEKVWNDFIKGDLDREIIGRSHGESVRPEARSMDNAVVNLLDKMLIDQTDNGILVMKLDGRKFKQTHNALRIFKSFGEDYPHGAKWSDGDFTSKKVRDRVNRVKSAWKKMMYDPQNPSRSYLNVKKSFYDRGLTTAKQIDNSLEGAWQGIMSGIHGAQDQGQVGPAKRGANADDDSRLFHFADADKEFDYLRRFGSGNIYDALDSEMNSVAAKVSMAEQLGPLNRSAWQNMVLPYLNRLAQGGPTDLKARIQKLDSSAQKTFDVFDGKWSLPVNVTIDKITKFLQTVTVTSKLGSTIYASQADLAQTHKVLSRYEEGSLPGRNTKALLGMFGIAKPQGKADELVLKQMFVDVESMRSVLGRMQWDIRNNSDMKDWMDTLSSFFYSASGMNWHNKRTRHFAIQAMSGRIGQMADYSWDELGGLGNALRRDMELFGFDGEDWKVLQQAATNINGVKYITMDSIMNVDRKYFAASLRARGLKDSPSNITREMSRVSRRYGGFIKDVMDNMVISPGLRERKYFSANYQRGTISHMAASLFFMFKSFPLTAMSRIKTRDFDGFSPTSAIMQLMFTSAFGSLLMYLSRNIQNYVNGRTALPANDMRTWVDMLAQSGGMPILGDALVAGMNPDSTADMTGQMMGPIFGQMSRLPGLSAKILNQLVGDNRDPMKSQEEWNKIKRESFNLLYNNIPGQNLFYMKPLHEATWLSWIREMIDPDRNKKMQEYLEGKGIELNEDRSIPNFMETMWNEGSL